MAKWKIEEAAFESLVDLNKYLIEKNIGPTQLLKYDKVFDQLKRSMKYMITYWVEIKD